MSARAAEIFDRLGELSANGLVEALGDTPPWKVRNASGTSLTLMCVFARLGDRVDALFERWPDHPLHEAAAAGRLPRVQALVARGCDALDLLTPDGWTALHLAAHLDHPDVVEVLLEAGADPDLMSRAFEQNLPIHAACAGRSDASVALIAPRTADLDLRVAEGFTALLEAAYQGQAGAVEILLDNGADPTVRNDAGKSASALAAEAGHEALADRLRRAEAR